MAFKVGLEVDFKAVSVYIKMRKVYTLDVMGDT